MLVRVGSRGSRLALTQAELALASVRAPGIELVLVPITTAGDRDRSRPFGEIGSRGVFVKELEEALLERLDESQRRAVEAVTAQIVNKLLHLPTVRMKQAAAAADGVLYAETVRHLFGLGE